MHEKLAYNTRQHYVLTCIICRYTSFIHTYILCEWLAGEKPYVCTWDGCGKRFTEYSSLYKHHVVHTHTKPYECADCGKTYRQTSTLAIHRRMAHGDNAHTESTTLVQSTATAFIVASNSLCNCELKKFWFTFVLFRSFGKCVSPCTLWKMRGWDALHQHNNPNIADLTPNRQESGQTTVWDLRIVVSAVLWELLHTCWTSVENKWTSVLLITLAIFRLAIKWWAAIQRRQCQWLCNLHLFSYLIQLSNETKLCFSIWWHG